MKLRNYCPVLSAYGLTLMVFGLLMLMPMIVAFFLKEQTIIFFEKGFLISFISGFILWKFTHKRPGKLKPRDGFLLVVLTWIMIPLFASIPLKLAVPSLTFTQAIFEAVSGITATGVTVIKGLDNLPISINLWRAFLHWIGGMGVIVLVVAILPLLEVGGRQMFALESPTPMKESSLTPRVTETAKGLWLSYLLLTIACVLCLYYCGMGIWDAIIHAFSVIGLGGFSSHDASLYYFNSFYIEFVIMFFALLSGMNYTTHYLALMRRSIRPYQRDPEIGIYWSILLVAIFIISIYLIVLTPNCNLILVIRTTAFQVVSMSTTLGLTANDYLPIPTFILFILLGLGSFVACSGSTGGGIKLMRAILLYKQVYREIIKSLHPNVVYPIRLNKLSISESMLHAVLSFSFIYMVSMVILTLFMSATGLDMLTSLVAIAGSLNNIGPSLEVSQQMDYTMLSNAQYWILMFTMVLGRLEVFTLLVVLTPAFWRT